MLRPVPYPLAMLALAAITVALAGCYGELPAPPEPTADRVPDVVGRLEGWATPNVSYRLDTGDVVEVHGPAPAALLGGAVWFPDSGRQGGLILAGVDARGAFYAATQPEDDAGCFLIKGEGYIDPDRIHLSSGLVLPRAADAVVRRDRSQFGSTWLFSFDHICLDREGRVTSIWQLPLGA